MKFAPLVLVSAVGLVFVPGCADDAPDAAGSSSAVSTRGTAKVAYSKDSINVDQGFANTVRVEDSELVVPNANNERTLARIKVGAVVAGNRDMRTTNLANSSNPYGFLRRVREIKNDGRTTTLVTDRAELSDWIDEGGFDFNDKGSLFGPEAMDLSALSLDLQDNDGQSTGRGSATLSIDSSADGPESSSNDGKIKVRPYVRISNSSITLNAQHDGYFRVHKTLGVPRGVDYRSHLIVDPTISADITAGVGASSGIALPESVDATLAEWSKTWRVNTAPIPIAGPIPVTVRFSPELVCKIVAGGTITATVHADIKGHGEVGFEGQATLDNWDFKNLSQAPSFSPKFTFLGVQAKANLTAECGVFAVASVMLFDAAGVEGKIGPQVSLTAAACTGYDAQQNKPTTGFTFYEQHAFGLEFAARAQVPILGVGKSFTLTTLDLVKGDRNYFVGDDKTCRF